MQSSRCCTGEEHDVSFLCQAPHLDVQGTCEVDTGDGEGLSGFETIGWQWCFNFFASVVSCNFAGQAAVEHLLYRLSGSEDPKFISQL
jgi:hypothetical protein